MNDGAEDFAKFLQNQEIAISKDFLIGYYKLTYNKFVSITDCVFWLDVHRDNLIKTLKSSYKENEDYIEITHTDELSMSILDKSIIITSSRRKYYKLTTECFKNIAMASNSKNGKMIRKYYIEMERIVKEFHQHILQENKKLINNMKPNKTPKKKGVYVWHYGNENLYRIGKAKDMRKRKSTHNSSHADNITEDFNIDSSCNKDLEKMVLLVLDNYRYRKNRDCFECSIDIIIKTIKQVNKLLLQHRKEC